MRTVTNITSQLATATGTKPFIVVRIWWDYNNSVITYYGDRDYGPLVKGKILQLSGIDSLVKYNGIGGATGNVSLKLDDSDGSIKTIMSTYDINKRWCFIYQLYDDGTIGAVESKGALLFQGQISTPIVWDEGTRTIEFDIVSPLESSEIGFTPEQGAFEGLAKDAIGKAWPCVFGSCVNVPATKIKTRPSGKSLTEFSWITYTELEQLRDLYEKYYRLKRQIDKTETYVNANWTAENLKVYEENLVKYSEITNHIKQLLAHLIGRNRTLEATVQEYVTQLNTYWGYKLDYEEKKLEELGLVNRNLFLRSFLDTTVGDPNKAAQYNAEWAENELALADLEDELEELEDNIEELESNAIMTTMKILNSTMVDMDIIVDGEDIINAEPENILVNGLRLDGYWHSTNKFRIQGILPTDTNIQMTTQGDGGPYYNQFWLQLTETRNLKNKFCYIYAESKYRVIYVTDHIKTNTENYCIYTPILYKKETSQKYTPMALSEIMILETCPIIRAEWLGPTKINWTNILEYGIRDIKSIDKDVEIKVGDLIEAGGNYPDVYVANMLSDDNYSDTVYRVSARRNGVVIPIPKSYYYIYYNYRIGNIWTTLVVLNQPLKVYDDGWEDEIYVTLTSSVRFSEGYVGSNPANILQYLVEQYTEYTPDYAQFTACESYLQYFPMNFALTERKNVLALIEDLAWQARCVVWLQNNVVHIKYLPTKGIQSTTITESDIKHGTLQMMFSSTDDVCTKFNCRWRKDLSSPENLLIIRNNIPKYGTIEQDYDFYAYNNYDLIKRCATFWMIRYSNSWKKVRFKGFMNLLALEAYDTVYFDFSSNYIASSGVYGIVESVNYDSDSNLLDIEVWLGVRNGEMFQYLAAWPYDTSSLTFPSAYDPYVGGYTDQRSYQVYGSGLDELGISYSGDFGDTGTTNISDSSAPSVPSPIDNVDTPDITIQQKRRIREPDWAKINILETKIYDPRTGFEGRLSDVFTLVKNMFQKTQGDETETQAHQYLAIKTDALVYGSYKEMDRDSLGDPDLDSDGNPTYTEKFVTAKMPFSYDTVRKIWIPSNVIKFFAKITGAVQLSGDNIHKWRYEWQECDPDGTILVDGRRFVANDMSYAYNLCEITNPIGGGTYGNSIVHDENGLLPGTESMRLQPVGGGVVGSYREIVVEMYEFSDMPNNAIRYLFQYENADDGEC